MYMKHGSSWSVFLSAASYCIWQVEISYPISLPRNPIKYTWDDIPVNVCNDEESKTICQALGNIETSIQTQHDIDKIYETFCSKWNVHKATQKNHCY